MHLCYGLLMQVIVHVIDLRLKARVASLIGFEACGQMLPLELH